MKGWKKRFFFLDRRAIPDAIAWRHNDSDVNNPAPEDGFNPLDVQLLTKKVIDLRLVPSGLLFQEGLATTWDIPGFCRIFKDTEGNVVIMSEYQCLPLLSGASIVKGTLLTNQDMVSQHTTPPLLKNQTISDKTDQQKEVEVETPRSLLLVRRNPEPATSERILTLKPVRTMIPTNLVVGDHSGGIADTAELQEDKSLHIPLHNSVKCSVQNYADGHDDNKETNSLRLGSFVDQSGRN
nr:hypothetical protein [Tanacetum cinerariifolium]